MCLVWRQLCSSHNEAMHVAHLHCISLLTCAETISVDEVLGRAHAAMRALKDSRALMTLHPISVASMCELDASNSAATVRPLACVHVTHVCPFVLILSVRSLEFLVQSRLLCHSTYPTLLALAAVEHIHCFGSAVRRRCWMEYKLHRRIGPGYHYSSPMDVGGVNPLRRLRNHAHCPSRS